MERPPTHTMPIPGSSIPGTTIQMSAGGTMTATNPMTSMPAPSAMTGSSGMPMSGHVMMHS